MCGWDKLLTVVLLLPCDVLSTSLLAALGSLMYLVRRDSW